MRVGLTRESLGTLVVVERDGHARYCAARAARAGRVRRMQHCFWRETLFFLVPKILKGYEEGKLELEE
jgi:hypothetical protein